MFVLNGKIKMKYDCVFFYDCENLNLILIPGMGAPLVGTAPIFALSFFGFDWGKQLVKDISGTGSKDLNALQLAAAGGFSGILTTTIMAPGERIKCILQVRINWSLCTWS